MGWTGGWGIELDEASVVVGSVSTGVVVGEFAIVVSALVGVVVFVVPHEAITATTTVTAISDRIGDGRRMSS